MCVVVDPPRHARAHQSNGSPSATSQPSPLAALLSKALQESEALKDDPATMRHRMEKAERTLAAFQAAAASHPSSSPSPNDSPFKLQLPDAARKTILTLKNCAEAAEVKRDEYHARHQWLCRPRLPHALAPLSSAITYDRPCADSVDSGHSGLQ